MKKYVHTRVIDSPTPLRDTTVEVTLVARPLLMSIAQNLCEYGALTSRTVCSLSNVTSHRNSQLLFVKHLAARIVRDKEVPHKIASGMRTDSKGSGHTHRQWDTRTERVGHTHRDSPCYCYHSVFKVAYFHAISKYYAVRISCFLNSCCV
jgi:hypothetical protein